MDRWTPLRSALVALGLLFSAGSASGQAVDIPLIVTGSQEQNSWVSGAVAHQVETGIDNTGTDSSGEFARTNVQLNLGHRFHVSDDLFVIGTGAYQGNYYNFDDAKFDDAVPTDFRWSDIHRGTFMVGAGWRNDDWSIIGLAIARTDGENGADWTDTLTGGAAVVVDYRWNEDLRTGLIIGAMSVLEDSVAIIPIPTVDWRFADDWRFHFGVISGGAYPGVGPEITWQGKYWNLGLNASYQVRRYRLRERDDHAVDNGIGQERSFPVLARIGYRASANFNISLNAGVVLGGEIRSGTSTGQRIAKEDYDPTPIVGAQAAYTW